MESEDSTPAGEREMRPLRIERGAVAMGTDGELGIVVQVVMSQHTPGLRAIIVRPTDSTQEIEIAAEHVLAADGDEVLIDFGRARMAADATLARPYFPERYTAIDKGVSVSPREAAHLASVTDQPVVTNLEADAVEVVAPPHDHAPHPHDTPAPRSVSELSVDWQAPGNIATVRPLRGERDVATTRPPTPRGATDGITPISVTGPDAEEMLDSPSVGVSATQLITTPRDAESPFAPDSDASYSSKKEHATMNDKSDQSLATPMTQSAQQKARQAATTPPSDGYLEGTTIPPQYQLPAPRSVWASPWVIGVGSAALIAGTAAAAIMWSQNSRPKGAAQWRGFMRGMRKATPSDWRSLANEQLHGFRATGSDQLHAWRGTTSVQLDAWRKMLDKQLHLWRKEVVPHLERNARLLSKNNTVLAQREAAKHAANAATSLAATATLASKQLDAWRGLTGAQLDAWRTSVGESLRSGSKVAVRGPKTMVKQTQIGARWFGRGAVLSAPLGVIGGLFIAPVTGKQLREQVWAWVSQGRTQAMDRINTYRTRQAGASATSPTLPGSTTPDLTTPTSDTLKKTGPIR